MKTFSCLCGNVAATGRLGAALAAVLPRGAVVALDGELGSGKTELVRAVAAAAGVDPRAVISPTFILLNEYAGRLPIYHFDAYRLARDEEFAQLGPEEYFAGSGWSFIEWAQKVARFLPEERLEVRAETTGETSRTFHFRALGAAYERGLDALAASLGK
ncbi:MAG: tRNA (adenosine(37)-N6)-threonylcarbamoyltransferase complex ATPase subunit type 1 TsaE [Planctomycetia bacterium]|nr:tRNA (adenosine(37)-N6)-threonylcarbamoyltransferase complex ATPase subunit type 1 TsaE [Planctomycetia bacterium]